MTATPTPFWRLFAAWSRKRAHTAGFRDNAGERGRYSVARSVALYVEYLYYYYNLHGQTALAPDLPSVFEQHGVRVGLMLWARPVGR